MIDQTQLFRLIFYVSKTLLDFVDSADDSELALAIQGSRIKTETDQQRK